EEPRIRAPVTSAFSYWRWDAQGSQNIFKTKSKRGESMTRRLVSGLLAGALVAVAGAAAAQYGEFRADTRGYVPGQAPCSMGYWCNSYPTATTGIIWRSGTYNGTKGLAGNLCWRAGFWTPAMAIKEC